ncbi:hypothetical protein MPSEU_000986400 [Mayamaea pseudoterrestris]|nr:hypothetical protein MPSEU_000986400 [Mayamaea pseudoterrestris]
MDQLLLNYHDACIYGRDLELLRDPAGWLNGDVIHFYGKRLEQDHSSILFLDPAVVSFFMHQLDDDPDDFQEFAQTTKMSLQNKRLAFIPVNNVLGTLNWMLPHQGTHWSLVLYIASDSDGAKDASYGFWHVDSIQHSSNQEAAERVARRWSSILRATANNDDARQREQATTDTTKLHHVANVPQQTNGHDCGMHVLLAAQVICEFEKRAERYRSSQIGPAMEAHLQCESILQMRQRISNDIQALMMENDQVGE